MYTRGAGKTPSGERRAASEASRAAVRCKRRVQVPQNVSECHYATLKGWRGRVRLGQAAPSSEHSLRVRGHCLHVSMCLVLSRGLPHGLRLGVDLGRLHGARGLEGCPEVEGDVREADDADGGPAHVQEHVVVEHEHAEEEVEDAAAEEAVQE